LVIAHVVPCTAPEAVTTFALTVVVGTLAVRPWRRRPAAFALPLVFAVLVGGAACSSKTQTASKRPHTGARLAIVSPTANEVTNSTVHLQFDLVGAKVVPVTKTALRGDEGHIHVSLDGKLVSMQYGLTQDLPEVPPGNHTIEAEFVAADHAPFANRVIAAVAFRVGP
jgi:hypothetical protein